MNFIHKYVPPKVKDNNTTIVLLHGTGGDEEDLLPLGQFLAPNAALLGIRGKVLEGNAPRFFRRLTEGVFDEQDLIFRTEELARFLEWACGKYSLDSNHLVAVGYSNGANIAASLLLLEPTILSAGVLFRAMVPLEPARIPDLHGKRVLMLSGRQDPIIPQANSERLAELLRQAGADAAMKWLNAGHGLTNPEFHLAQTWLNDLVSRTSQH